MSEPMDISSKYVEIEYKHVGKKCDIGDGLNLKYTKDQQYKTSKNAILFSIGRIGLVGHGKAKFVYDFSCGAGVKLTAWETYIEDNTSFAYLKYYKNGEKSSSFAPVFSARLNLGFGW
jgi:hypothetical protein